MLETITIDTEQWAVVPRDLMRRIEDYLSTERVSTGERLYNDVLGAMRSAPRPEAVRQSDAFLVWLPRLVAEYEKQARHNEFTPDVSLDFVKRALAEYQHAAKQPTPRPVPTSERLPTLDDADPWGNVLAFSKIWDVWSFAHWGTIAKYGNTIWLPTGLVRPAKPDGGAE